VGVCFVRASAGRDVVRVAEDEWCVDHGVAGGTRAGVVAHAPEAAVATGEALIGGEDDECVVVELVLCECVENAADAVVDTADFSGVALHGDVVVEVAFVSVQPGVHFFARERL
jgi:hypothetical protein